MPTDYATALALLRRASAGLPLLSRAHLLGRFLTCPFLAVVEALPPGGVVFDVGAGHGILARLAVEHRAEKVVALEPDVRKIGSGLRHASVSWVVGPDACVRGGFDAVVLCDVLYRVPGDERDRLLERLRERLKPGALLVLKEIDPDRRLKFAWNLLQESLALKIFRLTLGSGQTYETRDALRRRLEAHGFADVTIRPVDRGYLHPHVLYTARRTD